MDLIKPKLCAKHVLGMILNVLSLKDQFSKYVNGMRDPPLTFFNFHLLFLEPGAASSCAFGAATLP